MTHIHTHPDHHDLEEQGEIELVLIGLRYTGGRTIENTPQIQKRGGWQGPVRWNPGQVRFGFVPDWAGEDIEQGRNVSNIEQMGKFDVIYDPSEIAEILLRKNYLPPNVFGQAHDRRVRTRFFEEMGMEPAGIVYDRSDEGPYRDQLREIAGIEVDDTEQAEDAARSFSQEIKDDYPRSKVKSAAEILGYEGDVSNAKKTDLSSFIATFSKEIAIAALRGESVELNEDGDAEIVDADEPESLEDMKRTELQELYDELGGKTDDPEGDSVNKLKNDDLRAGIERLRNN